MEVNLHGLTELFFASQSETAHLNLLESGTEVYWSSFGDLPVMTGRPRPHGSRA